MNRRGLVQDALVASYHVEIKEMHMHNSQNNLLPYARSQLLRRSRSLSALTKLVQRTVGPRTRISYEPHPKYLMIGGTLVLP